MTGNNSRQPGFDRPSGRRPGNARVVVACVAMVAVMGGLAYASVPLYRLFCQVTGYGGTTRQVADTTGVQILDREIKIRFDANTAPGLGWEFYPAQRSVTVRLGEVREITYYVENNTGTDLAGTATFNVTPQSAGAFFNKLECFCFTETNVKAGEKLEMPVVFFVDPAIIDYEETKGFETLTLSYTFFPERGSGDSVVSTGDRKKPGSAGG